MCKLTMTGETWHWGIYTTAESAWRLPWHCQHIVTICCTTTRR